MKIIGRFSKRVSILLVILFSASGFLSTALAGSFAALSSWSADLSKTDSSKFDSYFPEVTRVEFVKPGDLKSGENFIRQYVDNSLEPEEKGILKKWIPDGANFNPLRPECHPSVWQEKYMNAGTNPRDLEAVTKRYFFFCERELKKYNKTGLYALAKKTGVTYKLFENSRVKPVRIYLTNGESIYGLMAIKDFQKKRPWVIGRCGITCRGGDGSGTTDLVMHTFDEGPFNVIMLASHTGQNVAIANKRVLFGGLHEGRETIAIGNWLKNHSPFKNLVSSVHSFGSSLGGHSALYSAVFENEYRKQTGRSIFNSVIGYCPVVRLEPTMRDLFRETIRGEIFTWVIWRQLKKVFKFVPDLKGIIDPKDKPENKEFPEKMVQAALKALSRQDAGEFLPPFKGKAFENDEQYWKRYDFLRIAKNLEVPTLVWGSTNDIIVSHGRNTGQLERHISPEERGGLQVFSTPDGSHCATAMSYGWEVDSKIFRSHFLKNSPEFMKNHKIKGRIYNFPAPSLKKGEKHIAQRWRLRPNKEYAELQFRIFTGERGDDRCALDGPYNADLKKCYRHKSIKIKLANLPFGWLKNPKVGAETQSLNRYLNSQYWLESTTGKLAGTNNSPRYLKWNTYF